MTAKEIVTRAQQIADLVNSDYIGRDENVALLTEAYQQIYQRLINSGDEYFLKEMPTDSVVEDGKRCIALPADFYQLNSVTYYGRPILRKTASQPPRTSCYRLRKEALELVGNFDREGLEVSYYPRPTEIELPAEGEEGDGTVFDSPNNLFYQAMAYSLAESYCVKQGKDPSLISAKRAEIEEQFYDSLNRDIFQPTRITNIYR